MYGIKYSWKSHIGRNRRKNRIKKSGASSVGLSQTKTVTSPPREGEPAGTHFTVDQTNGCMYHHEADFTAGTKEQPLVTAKSRKLSWCGDKKKRELASFHWWWLFPTCEDLRGRFDDSFPAFAPPPPPPPHPLFFFFLQVEISSRAPTSRFRPGSVNSGSTSWDDRGRVSYRRHRYNKEHNNETWTFVGCLLCPACKPREG